VAAEEEIELLAEAQAVNRVVLGAGSAGVAAAYAWRLRRER
jgi:hypothetical protein